MNLLELESKQEPFDKSFWLNHIELWKQSGKTITEYCQKNDINYHRFQYHRRSQEKKSKFSKLIVKEEITAANKIELLDTLEATEFCLEFPSKTKLTIKGKSDLTELQKILYVCKEVLC